MPTAVYQPTLQKNWVKGVNAVADRYSQPPGSVPRISNLVMTKRGSFVTCDGSQSVHAYNGVPTLGRGKIMSGFLFAPTGVPRYYLALAKANGPLDFPLGPPRGLTVATAGGGSLPGGTYYYKVTAIDGIGGETTASLETSVVTAGGGKNTLTWSLIPNAAGYRVYRSNGPGTESLLINSDLPVPQPAPGNTAVSWLDLGTATIANPVAVTNAIITNIQHVGATIVYTATWNVASTSSIIVGEGFQYIPGSNPNFVAPVTWNVVSIVNSTQMICNF